MFRFLTIFYMFWLLMAFLLLTACGAASKTYSVSYHNGPFFRTNWKPLVLRSRAEIKNAEIETNNHNEQNSEECNIDDLRDKFILEAKLVLSSNVKISDYGQTDLENNLKKIISDLKWDTSKGLHDFIEIAKSYKSYHAMGKPEIGDIVLFHNQVDANGNGESDDWLTGCGIVVGKKKTLLKVVSRTGNNSRLIYLKTDVFNHKNKKNNIINSYIKIPYRFDPADAEYLASQLYAGFINIDELFSSNCAR